MQKSAVTAGKNLSYLKEFLAKSDMDSQDIENLILKAKSVLEHVSDHQKEPLNEQGLLLGFVQSGKTSALTTVTALAADNKIRLFIILTSDNTWLYSQTIERLQVSLPGIQIEGKDGWSSNFESIVDTLNSGEDSLILVSTKNATVLSKVVWMLDQLKSRTGNELPFTLIIDDEADQASLDTQTSKRAKNLDADPGKISDLIAQLRIRLPQHTYLQVTATPQALFLQDNGNLYRPEFTVLIEPGKGYTGGETYFSLIGGGKDRPIRYIDQSDLDNLLDNTVEYSKEYPDRIPESLRRAICTFYIGSTIKYLQNKETTKPSELVYSFLCHISLKQEQHDKAFDAITSYFQYLKDSLRISSSPETQKDANQFLEFAYDDLKKTSFKPELIPPLVDVIDQLRNFIVGTEIQVLNSIKQKQPNYSRRYNILIGGTKLARGVTIKNLLVTYYGRQTKRANMDTMLQHARMYGYREKDLDVIRLYLTQEIEERFELINESEQALRNIIKEHPNEDYRGILIGNGVNATRSNVLNPFNMGSYAAGAAYFPRRPMFEQAKLGNTVEKINKISDEIYPEGNRSAIEVTIDDLLKILRIIKSAPNSGLWDDRKILMALQTLQKDPVYKNKAFLVVRRNVKRTPREGHKLNAIIAGGELDLAKDNKDFPTLFLYRVDAKKSIGNNGGWDGVPFWVPSLRFPDGNYALIFNLNDEL